MSCAPPFTGTCSQVASDEGTYVISLILYGILTVAWGMSVRNWSDKDKQAKVMKILGTSRYSKEGETDNAWFGTEVIWIVASVILGLSMAFIHLTGNYPLWLRIVLFSLFIAGLLMDMIFSKQFFSNDNFGVGIAFYVLGWLFYTTNFVLWLIAILRDNSVKVLIRRPTAITGVVLLGIYILIGGIMGGMFIYYWYNHRGDEHAGGQARGKNYSARGTKGKGKN